MRSSVQPVVGARASELCRAVVGEDVSQPAWAGRLFSEADVAKRLRLSLAWYTATADLLMSVIHVHYRITRIRGFILSIFLTVIIQNLRLHRMSLLCLYNILNHIEC